MSAKSISLAAALCFTTAGVTLGFVAIFGGDLPADAGQAQCNPEIDAVMFQVLGTESEIKRAAYQNGCLDVLYARGIGSIALCQKLTDEYIDKGTPQ